MPVAPIILEHYSNLNDEQKSIIGHSDGPMLVIAGPGSGKTHSIVLRALNLLLLGKAKPSGIALCTYTEKAAFEMRDRLTLAARTVGYQEDLSELTVSTIHGWCNTLLGKHRHHTQLGNNYETLDELSQQLFIFDHFEEIIGPDINGLYLGRWKTRWTAIEGIRNYFDKITEELIDPNRFRYSSDPFLAALGVSYLTYKSILFGNNRIDFANLQRIVFEMLANPSICQQVTHDLHYVLVDEYQDTNYIQQQLLFKLVEREHNICVVGDEDQSLYRFRGASVRNILEFPHDMPESTIVKLTTNYRSHKDIIKRYDTWMSSANWINPNGQPFRYDKTIKEDPEGVYPSYPAVFAIWGTNQDDEASRFAELVKYLKEKSVIEDYSQVALLLRSVRQDYSGPYLSALDDRGIPSFCPRARAFFENEVICEIVACFAVIFGWHGSGRGQVAGALANLGKYVDDCIIQLAHHMGSSSSLGEALRQWTDEIASLQSGGSLDMRPADYFYKLLGREPFIGQIKNENASRNLAIFSRLLGIFQDYYHYTVLTYRNREIIRFHFFNSFLRLLYEGGINEYEDPNQPFPKGYVQVMTIHQAKGLEFPVVAVGSLSTQTSTAKRIDRDLGSYYDRQPFEPENRITGFDRMRLHYVAFSRPQKILVLTTHETPKDYFNPIWQGLPQWPYVEKDLLAAQNFELKERIPIKKSYSFTGDIRIYETCPRQYQFFREYDFTPSRSAVIFFGLLVHQTIEELHRIALDGSFTTLNEGKIRELFERTFRFLCLSDVRPVGNAAREAAFSQVLNYFHQNGEEMKRIIQTEVDVSLEKESYILSGKVDLILGGDGKLELLDFKTSPRPTNSPHLIEAYERQLCTYAHILEQRQKRRVDRLLLYWTSEPIKKDALMVLPYEPARITNAGIYFDSVVKRIQAKEFSVSKKPESKICKECDLATLCRAEAIL